MKKAPTTPEKNIKGNVTTKNATQNFDYTTIENRLRAISWSNTSHPTGMVRQAYEYRKETSANENLPIRLILEYWQ